jgi:ADP-heptose:LPS heptosyltransferase
MGSLVLAKPMFAHIRRKHPEASVHVLLFERNRELLEILDVVPERHILSVRDASLMEFLADSLRALVTLRRVGVDTVLDCELFSRISSLYAFLSGAAIRVGFHPYTQEGLYRGGYINRPVLYNPYQHISHQFITLAEAIEAKHRPMAKRRVGPDPLEIAPAEFDRDETAGFAEKLEREFPRIVGKRLVLVYPGGGLLAIRAWPLANFRRLSKGLTGRGCVVGIIGLKEDAPLARGIISRCEEEGCIDLTGYTKSIRELMMLFRRASLLVTNDGGPAHFSVLTSTPTIALFGPETPTLYGPLGDRSYAFYVPLSCSPCLSAYNHRLSPCDGDNVCLKSITPEAVLRKAVEMLDSPTEPEGR